MELRGQRSPSGVSLNTGPFSSLRDTARAVLDDKKISIEGINEWKLELRAETAFETVRLE